MTQSRSATRFCHICINCRRSVSVPAEGLWSTLRLYRAGARGLGIVDTPQQRIVVNTHHSCGKGPHRTEAGARLRARLTVFDFMRHALNASCYVSEQDLGE